MCLYFAALRCTTDPPSVPLPRTNKSAPPLELSHDNCPPPFTSFLRVWASRVPSIQALAPEQQHDLARIICGHQPLAPVPNPAINGIAADLRAVAIEISQRRSFQDRYASALQAALDSGGANGSGAKKAAFVPPPTYDDAAPVSPSRSSSRPSSSSSSASSHSLHHSTTHTHAQAPFSPIDSASTYSHDSYSSYNSHSSPPHTPTLLTAASPAIDFIRETLYAALASALERHPALLPLLHTDPPRAYFAAVALGVLLVATTGLTRDGRGIVGVRGHVLGEEACPAELRAFVRELLGVGAEAARIGVEDDDEAMGRAARGEEDAGQTRLERVERMLERGVALDDDDDDGDGEGGRGPRLRTRSVQGRAVAFANRINALSLGMTRLPAFRERQDDVFKVLAGVLAR